MLTVEAIQVWPELGLMANKESNPAECSDHKLARAVDAGDMLGCSTGTSKSQLHKARLKLRKLLTLPPAAGCA